ncbi:hypothetical protein [Nonomuraea sp. JJY05]|uniref:hypothetical protein n=1 Tax=Nonomuraea sp. JJY05 TaxID=3350255 RepID=UPI00373F9E03
MPLGALLDAASSSVTVRRRLGQLMFVMDEGLVLLVAWGQYLVLLGTLAYLLLRRRA